MIYDKFELHNVHEVEEKNGLVRLYRFPRKVGETMGCGANRIGRYVAQTTAGCEMRFVVDGERAMIALSSIDNDGIVQIFRGDFAYYTETTYVYPVKKGVITYIPLLKDAQFERFPKEQKRGAFAPDVWRIMSGSNFTMAFAGIETYGASVRPPREDELPAKTLLCYGTSLTHGACATTHGISYVQLLGRFLNVQILNKAMGGSCMNEKAVADYFASGQIRFDALLLENGVNMTEQPKEYSERTEYLLSVLSTEYPQVPIYCVTVYPNYSNIDAAKNAACIKKTVENDEILRRLAAVHPNCHIIEGSDIIDKITDMTVDLIHLSDYGHICAAMRLAERIKG